MILKMKHKIMRKGGKMKKGLSVVLLTIAVAGITPTDVLALPGPSTMDGEPHGPGWSYMTFDIPGAVGRAAQAAIKYFLSDDNKLTAELVFKEGEGGGGGGSGGGGGCGGAYNPNGGSASAEVAVALAASSLTDIIPEASAYPTDVSITSATSVADLARFRVETVTEERAALDQLSAEDWGVMYRAQQRSIQAMTDALTMKKAYKELTAVADQISQGSYNDYADALSTVATRRILLDALMHMRKRVIAARVRAKAETMEVDINLESIGTAPSLPDDGGNAGEVTDVIGGGGRVCGPEGPVPYTSCTDPQTGETIRHPSLDGAEYDPETDSWVLRDPALTENNNIANE